MSAPKVYGLVLGLSIVAIAGVETASSAGRPAVAAASDETWTIPGAASIAGLNNTRFVSDLGVDEPRELDRERHRFVRRARRSAAEAHHARGRRDDGLPKRPRRAVGRIRSSSGRFPFARISRWSCARGRTTPRSRERSAVALPVYASGQLLAEGQTRRQLLGAAGPVRKLGLPHERRRRFSRCRRWRRGGDVLRRERRRGRHPELLLRIAAGFQQLSIASVAPAGLLVGRAQISVTRGHAAGYAVGADNVTGDTSLYPFEALPAGVQDVVVNGVARLNGRNNTFFRTDARFYNPTPSDVTVTVRFHAAGAANPTPQSAT